MAEPRIAVLATASPNGMIGGAERFYVGLRDALNANGMRAEIVHILCDESTFEGIEEGYLRCYDLDLLHFDGVISTKAPTYVVRHPNHVCYLQHTMRVFYDMFNAEFPKPLPVQLRQRDQIRHLDTAALSRIGRDHRFVIGHEVRERLLKYNDLDAAVLYQATTMSDFWCGDFEYLFLPGRLHRWKRVDLAIEAMRQVRAPVRLLISGTGEDANALHELAADDQRIHFIGYVSDAEILGHYANALAVLFVPYHEDFGLVTLEAFHSSKCVITCADSGEPARLVRDGITGFVCAADARELATRIDQLCADIPMAARMGRAGAEAASGINWQNAAATLAKALGY